MQQKKWNESGFRPPLRTYRLNWARRTSWGWWDEWDDTVLQTQDLKFVPWWSEAEHATSRSRKLPTILTCSSSWRESLTSLEWYSNSYKAEIFLHKPWRIKRFFQFKIIIKVLVSFFRLIWIPILRPLYICISLSAGIVFRRQGLTSTDVRLWRLKTVPALKRLSNV